MNRKLKDSHRGCTRAWRCRFALNIRYHDSGNPSMRAAIGRRYCHSGDSTAAGTAAENTTAPARSPGRQLPDPPIPPTPPFPVSIHPIVRSCMRSECGENERALTFMPPSSAAHVAAGLWRPMRGISAVSARRTLGAVIGVVLVAGALAVANGSPPARVHDGHRQRRGRPDAAPWPGDTRSRHPALGPGASWTLSLASDDDEGQVIDDATGATVTFDLPAVDGEATTYTVRAGSGTVTDTRRITVFSPDTVIRLGGVGAPDLRTCTVVPSTLSPATHVLLVLHGVGRDAEEYCASWVGWAAEADYLVLCPEFDEQDWPGAAGYNLGNVFSDDEGGEVNPEQRWAFTAAEDVHRFAAGGFGLDDTLFDMWGHSAGTQFVQRFVLFKSRSAVRFARREPAQQPQGRCAGTPPLHARAGHAHAVALARDPQTNWRLLDVPGAGHDQQLMAPAAQRFLLDADRALPRTCPLPDGDPCP